MNKIETTTNETTDTSKENAMNKIETTTNETASNPVGWDSVEGGFLSDREAADMVQTQEEFWVQPREKDFDLPPGWTREQWDMTEGLTGY